MDRPPKLLKSSLITGELTKTDLEKMERVIKVWGRSRWKLNVIEKKY